MTQREIINTNSLIHISLLSSGQMQSASHLKLSNTIKINMSEKYNVKPTPKKAGSKSGLIYNLVS